MNVIELQGVSKKFGSALAVDDVTLSVPKGSVFGFLGPNGAGKSTTINMLVGFVRPSSGSASVFGLDSFHQSVEIHKRIGFLAGDFALDKSLTGWQQIEYFGNLRGGYDKDYVIELANRLECRLDKKFKQLSRGNKQKLGLITALMHRPELLIFDEPTSGLDPLIQSEFNKIILEQKAQGVTTFISSHILSEVQEICDYVAFIRTGKIVASKALSEVINSSAKHIVIKGADKSLTAKLRKIKGVDELIVNTGTMSLQYTGDVNDLIKTLAASRIDSLEIKESDLEGIFMGYYEGRDA